MDIIENIFANAFVRKFVDENMPEGMRIDVMEKIIIPSKEGDYSNFDVLIMVESKEDKNKILKLIENKLPEIKIVVICI